eukprot:4831279-Prymnesium_polylepis.1
MTQYLIVACRNAQKGHALRCQNVAGAGKCGNDSVLRANLKARTQLSNVTQWNSTVNVGMIESKFSSVT